MNQVKKKCLQVVVVALVQQLSHMVIYYTRCKREFTTNFCCCDWCIIKPDDDATEGNDSTIAHGVVFERVKESELWILYMHFL